jgi:hypothetical protein
MCIGFGRDNRGDATHPACDFDAEIVPFEFNTLGKGGEDSRIPGDIRKYLGTLDELKAEMDKDGNIKSEKHAALFWVRYETEPMRPSLLLYFKASITGNETADVLNYYATHPEFPHESTGDQFFNEEQWESYRKLGEHMGSTLFANPADPAEPAWFWSIPLERPISV